MGKTSKSKNERLWIALPEKEKIAIEAVIEDIGEKNLPSLSVKELHEKLDRNEASAWKDALTKYRSDLSVSEMSSRLDAIKAQFKKYNYPMLEDVKFKPNELLALISLSYSNPSLIGPNISRALYEKNHCNVAKEILTNSSYVRREGRIVPWVSNDNLKNYAFYSSDTSASLPPVVLNKIREAAIRKNITLTEIGQPTSNCTCPIFFCEPSNASSTQDASTLLISSLFSLHILKNIPIIGPIARNFTRSLWNGFSSITSFFKENNHHVPPMPILEQENKPLSLNKCSLNSRC